MSTVFNQLKLFLTIGLPLLIILFSLVSAKQLTKERVSAAIISKIARRSVQNALITVVIGWLIFLLFHFIVLQTVVQLLLPASAKAPLMLHCSVGTGYSFYHNTHGGGYKEVRWRYTQRLTNAYRLIDSKPGNVVIVSHFWMINDFAYLFDKRYFFAASNNDSLSRLLPLLKKNGVRQYIYVFDPRGPTLPPMLEDSSTRRWWDAKKQKIWIKDDYAAKVYTIQ